MLSLAFRATDRLFCVLRVVPPPRTPMPRPIAELDPLHRRKAEVQARLRRLLEPYSSVCAACAGRCCGQAANAYFGPFDEGCPGTSSTAEPCCHRGPNGCSLDARQRPARCVAYVCPALAGAMSVPAAVQVLAQVALLVALSSAVAAALAAAAAANARR